MSAIARSGVFTPLLFSLVVLSGVLLSAWYFLLHGVTSDTTLLFTRYTARVSFFFFLPVFALGALHRLYPTEMSRVLIGKRRQLGLAFAAAHAIHLVGIVLHFEATDTWFNSGDLAAIIIYVLIGLMAITSNAISVRRLKGGWKILHKVGLYGIFVGFFVTYLGRVLGYAESTLEPALMDPLWIYVALLSLVTAAWLLRIAVFWQKRA